MLFMVSISLPALCEEASPILLLYGFQPIPGFRATQIWTTFAETFSGNSVDNAITVEVEDGHEYYYLEAIDSAHRDVILSNPATPLEPTVRDIFYYVRRFTQEILSLATEFDIHHFDIVAHSMGGLIARAYVEGADFPVGEVMPYGGEVGTLVLLATPNHGSEIAALGEWFSTLGQQMAPGAEFLRDLNDVKAVDDRMTSLNPTIRYVSMAGQTCLGCGLRVDSDACKRACVEEGLAWSGSDLVVMMASAYLPGAENCALIGFDHVASHTDASLAAFVADVIRGAPVPAAFYAPKYELFRTP
jgi:hypothetical protein